MTSIFNAADVRECGPPSGMGPAPDRPHPATWLMRVWQDEDARQLAGYKYFVCDECAVRVALWAEDRWPSVEVVRQPLLELGYAVVLRTAKRAWFLNDRARSRSAAWASLEACTRFVDPADAIAAALRYSAEVAALRRDLGGDKVTWRLV